MNLALVSPEEAILPVQEAVFPLPDGLIDSMVKIMRDNGGIGLAGCQVGWRQALFIIQFGEKSPLYVVCNPRLTVLSQKNRGWSTEGCLTLPGQKFIVPRWGSVKLEGQDQYGEHFEWNCKGQLAIAVQHEVGHTLGWLIDGTKYSQKEGQRPVSDEGAKL